jgi:uncharacterized protein
LPQGGVAHIVSAKQGADSAPPIVGGEEFRMSAAQSKASEPSMEEILASIRKIISDEPVKTSPVAPESSAANQSTPAPAAPLPAAAKPAASLMDDDDDEVMELTPKPKVKVVEPHFITDDPVGNDISFEDAAPPAPKSQDDIDALMSMDEAPVEAPPPVAAPTPVFVPPPPAPMAAPAPVLASPPAPAPRLMSEVTDRAASHAFASLTNTILNRDARTLDDLMQDMLRPMIKTWLDDNLPTVVERLVKAEIERVSRGGR